MSRGSFGLVPWQKHLELELLGHAAHTGVDIVWPSFLTKISRTRDVKWLQVPWLKLGVVGSGLQAWV